MKSIHGLILLCALYLLAHEGMAQQVLRSDFKVGLHYSRPVTDFARITDDKAAFGLGLAYHYQIVKGNPLLAGLLLNYQILNSRNTKFTTVDDEGTEFRVRENWTNQNLQFGLSVNYHFLQIERFAPFVEGQFGLQYMFTLSNWTDLDGNREFDVITEKGDLALFYGLAFGLDYSIASEYGLYIKCERTFGQSTEYYALMHGVDEDDVEYAADYYRAVESTTDMLTFEAGIIHRF